MLIMKISFKNLLHSIFYGVDFRPFLIAVVAIIFTATASLCGWKSIVAKPLLETIALILTGAALAVYAFRAKTEQSPLTLIMSAFCFTFFCREIHFPGTSDGVYIGTAGIAVWAWFWRKRLIVPFHTGRFKTWFFAMGWTYFLALFIQRRAFKHLIPIPEFLELEQALHIELEEALEVTAHALLLVTAFCGTEKTKKADSTQP